MAKTERSHPVPRGLKVSGRRLWKSTVDVFELEEHELGMLREACRTADAIDGLQAAVDRDGVLNVSSQGLRAHPALVELRQQRIPSRGWSLSLACRPGTRRQRRRPGSVVRRVACTGSRGWCREAARATGRS